MQSLQKQFHDFILANDLVKKGEKVLLAVSGGLDSMVLARLFLDEKISFAIAHCNYGLRGNESDDDEAFVLDWADVHEVDCHVKAIEITGSIQLEARKARYQWFGELVSEYGFDKIATAHHLNDSLETLLLNLSRGTGIKGLTGITMKHSNVIRPLLFADRKMIHDYAMQSDLDWREDSTNAKTDYDRNLIRHEVVTELLKLNPSLFQTFRSTVERLNHTSQIVDQKVKQIRKDFLTEENEGFRLELSWITDASDELILAELLSDFGMNYVTAKEVFEARERSGKSFPLGNWLITVDRNMLYIDPSEVDVIERLWLTGTGEYQFGGKRVLVEQIKVEEVEFGSEHTAYFDTDALKFPLLIRAWQQGDKLQPLGMKGEKKVSDYLIDEKVPMAEKSKVLVLESGKKIAWLIERRISDLFKITDSTASVIKISIMSTPS